MLTYNVYRMDKKFPSHQDICTNMMDNCLRAACAVQFYWPAGVNVHIANAIGWASR